MKSYYFYSLSLLCFSIALSSCEPTDTKRPRIHKNSTPRIFCTETKQVEENTPKPKILLPPKKEVKISPAEIATLDSTFLPEETFTKLPAATHFIFLESSIFPSLGLAECKKLYVQIPHIIILARIKIRAHNAFPITRVTTDCHNDYLAHFHKNYASLTTNPARKIHHGTFQKTFWGLKYDTLEERPVSLPDDYASTKYYIARLPRFLGETPIYKKL